jgi:putative protein kinase ArgK-like GTPase of G3E family
MTPALRQHVQEAREAFRDRETQLKTYKAEMTRYHRDARGKLKEHQSTEWDAETRARSARLPRGLRGILARLTGKYRQVRNENEAEAAATRERHAAERQKLIQSQLKQRAVLAEREKELRQQQAERLSGLRRDIGRYLALGRDASTDERAERKRTEKRENRRSRSTGLKLSR